MRQGTPLKPKRAIFFFIALLLFASIVAAFRLWPKKYTVGTNMPEAIAFWNDREAFLFLSLNTTGRAQNELQEKLSRTKYGYLSLFLGNSIGFQKQDVVAYHLRGEGKLDRFSLPQGSVLSGSWKLVDGQLELIPPAYFAQNRFADKRIGFRWDGENFVPVDSAPQADTTDGGRTLTADDDEDEDDYGILNKAERQQFKAAGWHYKLMSGYGSPEATLPMTLSGNTFNLTLASAPPQDTARGFDFLLYGAKSIQLSGEKLGPEAKTLWSRSGWQTITKAEFENLNRKYGRGRYQARFPWTPLIILALLVVWKFASWFDVLFTFGTMKRRILKNMATSYSFPPATPAQFPALDIQNLDRYTRELEGMGFTRLLDFSLVSDSPVHPPSFCRLLAHTRHHCFGVISQMFPRGKAPLPLRCSYEGCLQDGWTLAFSNRKPQATSSLLRRRKALGVCMPDATSSELLQSFLKMREQVCLDLGISPVNDDTLQAFINKTQRAVGELREAVQQKNFVKGLPEVYLRKFSLLKAKPEYIWLGDYPKEAERRKQGLSSFATAGR